jgi:hypothetical protein
VVPVISSQKTVTKSISRLCEQDLISPRRLSAFQFVSHSSNPNWRCLVFYFRPKQRPDKFKNHSVHLHISSKAGITRTREKPTKDSKGRRRTKKTSALEALPQGLQNLDTPVRFRPAPPIICRDRSKNWRPSPPVISEFNPTAPLASEMPNCR